MACDKHMSLAIRCALYLADHVLDLPNSPKKEPDETMTKQPWKMTRDSVDRHLHHFLEVHPLFRMGKEGETVRMTKGAFKNIFEYIFDTARWNSNRPKCETAYQKILAITNAKSNGLHPDSLAKFQYDKSTFTPDDLVLLPGSQKNTRDTARQTKVFDSERASSCKVPVGGSRRRAPKRSCSRVESPSSVASKRAKTSKSIAVRPCQSSWEASGAGQGERRASRQLAKNAEQEPGPRHLSENAPSFNANWAFGFEQQTRGKQTGTDLNSIKISLEEISTLIQKAVVGLFDQIGLRRHQDSPIPAADDIDPRLQALFIYCFGNDYVATCRELGDMHRFSATQVLRALVGAHLSQSVFGENTSWRNWKCPDYNLPVQSEGQQAFDLMDEMLQSGSTLSTRRESHYLFARRLQSVTNAGSTASLKGIAGELSAELIEVLEPYIGRLAGIAYSIDPDAVKAEHCIDWQFSFGESLGLVIEKAVQLRVALWMDKQDHVFSWPSSGSPLEPAWMEPLHNSARRDFSRQQVAFAFFPSVEVSFAAHGPLQMVRSTDVISRAMA